MIQAVQPKGGITLVQAQQPAFQFLDPSAGAKRVCGPAIRSTRCGRPPAVGIQVPQRPPRGPYGCTGTCPLWFGKYADGFFRMSMTLSFSSSFLRSARISVSSSRRRLASRFWRSACPGDGAPAAFSQLRSVSMQMPSSAATVPFPVSWTVKMKKNRKKRRISCRITLRRRDAQTRHARRHPEDASQ